MRRVTLGRTGLSASPIGLGASYGLDARGVREAFDRGINFFYWGALPRPSFGRGLRELAASQRDDVVVMLQGSRYRRLLRRGCERELRKLGIDQADFLLLGWRDELPSPAWLEAAQALKEEGKVRHIAISCHHRPSFKTYIEHGAFDMIMVRYNAVHTGAEREVFPHLPAEDRPAVLAYTATSWGQLLNAKRMPPDEATPEASDCYRFALAHPDVDACLSGPKNRSELEAAVIAASRAPLEDAERTRMRQLGAFIHAAKQRGDESLVTRMVSWVRG